MDPISIITKRLILRKFETSDLDAIHHFASDEQICEHLTWGPNTLEQTQSWLNATIDSYNTNPRSEFSLAVTQKDSHLLIGTCLLTTDENSEGEIGYTIKKEEWKKGYATEVTSALIKFGFETLNLRRISATTSPLNIASQSVLKKSGMKQVGHLQKHLLQRGQWRDSLLYAILKEEWIKNNE